VLSGDFVGVTGVNAALLPESSGKVLSGGGK